VYCSQTSYISETSFSNSFSMFPILRRKRIRRIDIQRESLYIYTSIF
jgi:hypothetical protein